MAELFGWKKGAFTGAAQGHRGLHRARRGRDALHRRDRQALAQGPGGPAPRARGAPLPAAGRRRGERRADVRFIVGTNADLRAAVRARRFREDLYYRINVLPVRVPPLAERRDEIPRWADYMLDRRHRGGSRAGRRRSRAEAEQALAAHAWPGNLRQLDNIVRRAYALALMRHGASASALVIEARDVERALAYEGDAGTRVLLELYQLVASAFVAEAERRRPSGGSLDLDLADALRGFVLGTAVQRVGSKEEAFRLLGKEAVVQNRNHGKVLKKEIGPRGGAVPRPRRRGRPPLRRARRGRGAVASCRLPMLPRAAGRPLTSLLRRRPEREAKRHREAPLPAELVLARAHALAAGQAVVAPGEAVERDAAEAVLGLVEIARVEAHRADQRRTNRTPCRCPTPRRSGRRSRGRSGRRSSRCRSGRSPGRTSSARSARAGRRPR